MYTGVERCNTVIDYLPGVEDIDPTVAERYNAEAHFLRAWYYHWLWKFWGNIPYYDHVLKSPYMVAQMSADSVYTHIMSDLAYATGDNQIGNHRLPNTVQGSELGRATYNAAIMLKARCILYQNDMPLFNECLQDMRRLTMAGYTLTPQYLGGQPRVYHCPRRTKHHREHLGNQPPLRERLMVVAAGWRRHHLS